MNTQHLTVEQQARFETFFDSVLRLLGAGFEGKRDTFMIAPLRYTQSTIFPTDKTMSRNQLRTRIEYALVRAGDTISTEGRECTWSIGTSSTTQRCRTQSAS